MHIKSVLRNESQKSVCQSDVCTFLFYYIQALGAETD